MSSDTDQCNRGSSIDEINKRVAQTVASRKREYGMEMNFKDATPESTPEKPRRDGRRFNSREDEYSSEEESINRSGKKSSSKHSIFSRNKKSITEIKICMIDEESKIQEIEGQCKAKFLYKPFVPLPNLSEYLGNIIKVVIESDYLTNANPTIIKRHIWGNDFYSSDSDIVCILQHIGVLRLQEIPPAYKGIEVYFKVIKNRSTYISQFKNGIKSRKTQSFEGHSLKFENAKEIDELGSEQQLIKLASLMPTKAREVRRKQKIARKAKEGDQEMSIVFNLSCEPINKFNLGEFGDKRSVNVKVSTNLHQEVLYLESLTKRYELSYCKETKLYQFKEVKDPLFKGLIYMKSKGIPLSDEDVTSIFTDLKWNELVWDEKSLEIRDNFKIPYINGYLFLTITT